MAKKLSKEERSALGKAAARARWARRNLTANDLLWRMKSRRDELRREAEELDATIKQLNEILKGE